MYFVCGAQQVAKTETREEVVCEYLQRKQEFMNNDLEGSSHMVHFILRVNIMRKTSDIRKVNANMFG